MIFVTWHHRINRMSSTLLPYFSNVSFRSILLSHRLTRRFAIACCTCTVWGFSFTSVEHIYVNLLAVGKPLNLVLYVIHCDSSYYYFRLLCEDNDFWKMAGASILVHVTHIDDSVRGRQGPCIFFWGITHDRSKYLLMEKYLENIRYYLEKRPPPLNLKLLDRVCCVLINHHWLRARVLQPKLSDDETIEVICIDYGDTHTVPLAFVRSLDIPGTEAEYVREWPPLATKFILADIVAPKGPGSRSHWSEPAMMFLKVYVENRNWKAEPLGMYGEHQRLRLFNSNNKLLATLMIQQELGVATLTYHEVISMYETLDKQPDFIKPAFNALSAGGGASNVDYTLPLSFAIPATFREHQQEKTTRSNNDRLKKSNDKGNIGKSHYVHPNAKDSNSRTDGAEDATQSGQGKASSIHCNQSSSSYQAQDTIRKPRGSTVNGEMKGPLRSQKSEKVDVRSQIPLIQPGVEQSISVKQQPQQALSNADSQVEVCCVVDPTSFNVFNLCFF